MQFRRAKYAILGKLDVGQRLGKEACERPLAGGCGVKGYVVNSQGCSPVVSISLWKAGGFNGSVDGCFLPALSSPPSLQRKREWGGAGLSP